MADLYDLIQKDRPGVVRRMEKYSRRDPETGCVEWTGCVDKKGYGKLQVSRRPHFSHRIAYVLHHGRFDSELCVLHHCDNPRCCNPEHLFLGTRADNVADRDAKGRTWKGPYPSPVNRAIGNEHWTRKNPDRVLRGERGSKAKLSEQDVVEMKILRSTGITYSELGARFGVTKAAARFAVSGKNWSHLHG